MKNQNGFIQMPLFIAIIASVLVLGGAGYFGVKQYQSDKAKLMHENVSTAQTKRVVLSNSEIVNQVKPATVFIETKKGAGSGMIIDKNGYILTNAHVVWNVSAAKIKLSDGKTLSAEVIGRDEIIDLAILKIVGNDFSKVTLGDSDSVMQGEDVFTLGYPFGLEGDVSFKEGTISRRISDGGATYFETSAEIHPGNSGGPLVNKYGEVVGINTASYGQSIRGVTVGETIKLAIPINIAKNLIPELKGGRKIVIDHAQYEPSAGVQNSGKNQVKAYVSAILNTYIPERTKFYRIDQCLVIDINVEFKTVEAHENCVRQAWIEESAMLPNLNSLLDSIPVPAPMETFARTEKLSLYSYSLCRESQARLLNGEKIYGFSFDECSHRTFKIFEQARDEMTRVRKEYGL